MYVSFREKKNLHSLSLFFSAAAHDGFDVSEKTWRDALIDGMRVIRKIIWGVAGLSVYVIIYFFFILRISTRQEHDSVAGGKSTWEIKTH